MKRAVRERRVVAAGHENLRVWDITSADGQIVRVWSNQARAQAGPDALTVVACAGLGTPPEAWPTLLAQPERYRVVGAYYRGTAGSPRPAGPKPTIEDHVADIVALMDHEGIDAAHFIGWSMGVNIACQAAVFHPDRVLSILGVAGVPGDTFGSLLGPLPVPRGLRKPIGNGLTQLMSVVGGSMDVLARALPPAPTGWLLRHLGIALPSASPAYMDAVVAELLKHDFRWYFRLANGCGAHGRVDCTTITQPVTLLGGKYDVLTSAKHIGERAAEIADCRFEALEATHFLPLELPVTCEQALLEVAARAVAEQTAA